MSDSVSLLETIDGSQVAHEVTANALFDAGSVSTAYGRHAEACAGLTWGYYGARYGGNAIANGTNACGASTTTYQVTHLTTGAVTFSTATTNWNSTTYGRDFLIVSGASTITSYQDHRFGPRGVFTAAGVAGSGDALKADPLSQFAATTSAQLAGVISDETGTGALVFAGSPVLTGTPTAPTAAAATNTTQLATTEFVRTEVANLIASSPAALDTLDELAAALGDDANFASTITTALALKAPLASPALTGTPTVPTAAPGTNTTQAASTAFVTAATTGFGAGDALTANPLSQFAATTSAQMAGVISDETGSGALVFGTSPTLVTPALGTPSALVLTNATGLPVAGGGTGVATLTAYAPVFGGTTGTGAVQSGTAGTSGHVLTSNGAGVLPTFQATSRVGLAFEKEFALSDLTTAITTGTTKGYFRPAFAASGVSARASLRVASSSGIPTVDMNKAGATMMSTKLTIDASETTSQTAATAVVMSTTTWAIDDLIEFDIDVAGTGAMGLVVTVTGLYA